MPYLKHEHPFISPNPLRTWACSILYLSSHCRKVRFHLHAARLSAARKLKEQNARCLLTNHNWHRRVTIGIHRRRCRRCWRCFTILQICPIISIYQLSFMFYDVLRTYDSHYPNDPFHFPPPVMER